ncbi:hypothetical protein FisN_20Lh021 [Fistulifera solaris]|uniref:HMG box domain-containing protein n=1 Tax=Fistulifera solaris TaxID=1519565 RepID=A0A1Z5JWG0_FISSO|nr:hypothetical protein FisN_20Lh021 [Fistulifera solaris]|eukprot:GAX18259.1 hypothetical protein FisN_20Lh021 [Fistulifera solaris]
MSDDEAPGHKQKATVVRKKTITKREKKKIDDDGKPKRPLSAYNLFFRDERVKWNEEQEAAGEVLHAKERFLALGRAMSARWMVLPEADKKVYKDEAEAAMEKYRAEMAAWQSQQKEKLKEAKVKKPAAQPAPEIMNANPRAQQMNNISAAGMQPALNQQGLNPQLGGMFNQNTLGMQQPGMAQLLGAGGLDPQMQQLLMNNQAMLGGMGMGGMGMGAFSGLGGMGGLQGANMNMGGFGLAGGNVQLPGSNAMGMFQNDQLAQLQLRQQQLQQQQLQQQLQQQQFQQQQLQQQQQFGGMSQQQHGLPNQQQQPQFGGLQQNGLSPQLGSMGGGDMQQQQLLQEYLRQQQLQQQQQQGM